MVRPEKSLLQRRYSRASVTEKEIPNLGMFLPFPCAI